MNTDHDTPPAFMATLRSQLSQRWLAFSPKERMIVAVLGAGLGSWLLWSVALAPALTTLSKAPAQIAVLDAQLQTMQRLAAESKELRGAAPVPSAQALEALKSATDRLGEKARITLQGDRSTLTLNGVSAEQLKAWLSEARSGARARPVETQLTRGPEGYSGTLIVSLGSSS